MPKAINYGHGLSVVWSRMNCAYFVFWHGTILRVISTKAEAVEYAASIAFKPNPSTCACPECQQ